MGDYKDKTRGGKGKDDFSDPDPDPKATGRSGKEAYAQENVPDAGYADTGADGFEHMADAGGGEDFADTAADEDEPPDPKRRGKKF
jgi:hypothetical protein